MNEAHMEFCLSPEWRQMLEEQILPPALRDHDLGDDVIEIGPGPGFTTDILRQRTPHVTAVEIDDGLASALAERLAGTNVDVVHRDATDTQLRGDRFSAATSFNMLHHVPTAEAFHENDTYNPIDPAELPDRLRAAGFDRIAVERFELGWIATAHAT